MPTLTSFPHFYQADESIIEQIDGLDPQKELHESYVDLHPVSFDYYLLLGVSPENLGIFLIWMAISNGDMTIV